MAECVPSRPLLPFAARGYRLGRDAVLLGMGAGILATSRPFEGFLCFLPVAKHTLYILNHTRDWTPLLARGRLSPQETIRGVSHAQHDSFPRHCFACIFCGGGAPRAAEKPREEIPPPALSPLGRPVWRGGWGGGGGGGHCPGIPRGQKRLPKTEK